MIDELITDIKNYIGYLESQKLYISIQTEFTEYLLPLIDFYIHKNPRCLNIKSDTEMWDKCIKYHDETKPKANEVIITKCHAGINEALFGLSFESTIRVSSAKDFDTDTLCTLVKPLCRMVEYLESLIPHPESEVTESELINRAIKYIKRNFARNITNKEIAGFLSCSESNLCHLFKSHLGVSVHSYIIRMRIDNAKKLLQGSNQSIALIATKSGFSDYNYFSSSFKKITGLSPKEYRKKPVLQ